MIYFRLILTICSFLFVSQQVIAAAGAKGGEARPSVADVQQKQQTQPVQKPSPQRSDAKGE